MKDSYDFSKGKRGRIVPPPTGNVDPEPASILELEGLGAELAKEKGSAIEPSEGPLEQILKLLYKLTESELGIVEGRAYAMRLDKMWGVDDEPNPDK